MLLSLLLKNVNGCTIGTVLKTNDGRDWEEIATPDGYLPCNDTAFKYQSYPELANLLIHSAISPEGKRDMFALSPNFCHGSTIYLEGETNNNVLKSYIRYTCHSLVDTTTKAPSANSVLEASVTDLEASVRVLEASVTALEASVRVLEASVTALEASSSSSVSEASVTDLEASV